VFVKNIATDPQAQARSANSFGSEEWFEQSFDRFFGHAVARICNNNSHPSLSGAPVSCICRTQEQSPTIARPNGVIGIAHEVGEYLAEFRAEALQSAYIFVTPLYGGSRAR
jgi:hypothetical protein